MKEKIKLAYIYVMRIFGRILYVFPIKKNRVIFESFSGDGYSCNPKYISEELKKKYGEKLEIVWAVKENVKLPNNVVRCKYRSFLHFFYRLTAKVYVSNFLQASEVPKRKKQIYIQTWHGGGCYKTVGSDEKELDLAYIIRRDLQIKETDLFVVSSEYWENEVLRKQFHYKGKVLRTGMPRNDKLMGKETIKEISNIRNKAGIDLEKIAVLYAPTWRKNQNQFEQLDSQKVVDDCKKRFGKECQILFRAHLYGKEKQDDVLDLSKYPDMQELLYACDVLITDYSSSMWDFSLTGKPCFLFTPDLDEYLYNRGFDKDIYTWGFPVCRTNMELEESILKYDDKVFADKMKQHQKELKSYEMGTASQTIADEIYKICNS